MQNGRVTLIAADVPAPADPAGMGARRPDDASSTPRRSSAARSRSQLVDVPEREALDIAAALGQRLHRRAAPGRRRERARRTTAIMILPTQPGRRRPSGERRTAADVPAPADAAVGADDDDDEPVERLPMPHSPNDAAECRIQPVPAVHLDGRRNRQPDAEPGAAEPRRADRAAAVRGALPTAASPTRDAHAHRQPNATPDVRISRSAVRPARL